MIDVTGHDEQVIGYILNWWDLHPADLAWLDRLDGRVEINEFRYALFDRVNAATDGHLETLVERGSLDWIWLVGAATALTLKETEE